MPEFQIKRHFAKHEGGTKFYQVWTIAHHNTAVAVFQYGPYSAGLTPEICGGTIDVQELTTQSGALRACVTKAKAKQKRGYEFQPNEVTYEPKDAADFSRKLSTMLGLKKAQVVLSKFATISDQSKPAPDPDVENLFKGSKRSIAPVVKTENSLPEWGTW